MRPILAVLACLTPLYGQGLAGTWCTTSDPSDCARIRQNGESIQADFLKNGRAYSEGVGWLRGSQLVVAYRRLDNNDAASWNAEWDGGGRLTGRVVSANGSVRASGIYVRQGEVSSGAGNIDPVGVWKHVEGASWTITRAADGRYFGKESGLGEASGPAYFTSSGTFKIDYVTRDGSVAGYYEVRFANDGRTATGSVRELTGQRRTGSTSWTRISGGGNAVTPSAPAPAPPPAVISGNIDPVGVWKHVEGASWTITRAADGRYFGKESGLGEASGPAYFTSSGTFKIDYVTRDGSVTGYYEVRFANDGRTATGSVRELTGQRRTGSSNWTRISGGGSGSGGRGGVVAYVNPTGTWAHGQGVSWTISPAADGKYFAKEQGLGEASGPAYFTASGTFRIDYVTRDGSVRGYYEMTIAPDGRTATGTVRELNGPRRSGSSQWTRLSGGETGSIVSGSGGGEPWLPGSFDWVSGQFLVVHPQNRITVYLNGSKINEGRWEYLGNRQFRFTHERGGYVDTVELSPDNKYLNGRNNQGQELRGVRRVTSPRP